MYELYMNVFNLWNISLIWFNICIFVQEFMSLFFYEKCVPTDICIIYDRQIENVH